MNTNLRRLGSRAGGQGLFFLLAMLVFAGTLSAQDPKAWVAAAEASQVRYNAYATLRIASVRPTYTRVMEVRAWNFSNTCLLYTSPSPRDTERSRMPSSA